MSKFFVSIIKEDNYVIPIEAGSKEEAKKLVETGQYDSEREVHIKTVWSKVEFCF